MIMLLSTTSTSARFSRSVGRAMLAGAEAVRTLLKRRRTYGSLSTLDDRMLHDIGLQRSTLTAAIARVLFETRRRIAADELRRFETALGPSQLKEMSQSAFGPPTD